jgi:hypothetical protein
LSSNKELKLGGLADRGDELYNVVSNAAYWQMCVVYFLSIFFSSYPLSYLDFFINAANQ